MRRLEIGMRNATRALVTLFLTATVLLVLWTLSRPACGETLQNDELNYRIELPAGWVRMPQAEAWTPHGIVVGAVRELEQLKDGTAASGEGGELYLAITDVPGECTLDALAADAAVRGFLLKRFGPDPASWPEVSVASATHENGLEVRILQADGKAPNLRDRAGPVRALMILAKAKGKLYKLRAYVWHTAFDAEGLKGDLDFIEIGFTIPDPRPAAQKEPPGAKPPADAEQPAPLRGDEGEEVVRVDERLGWRLRKPVGLISKDDYDRTTFRDVGAWFEDNQPAGSYQIILYVVEKGRRDDRNQPVADVPLKGWALDRWWPAFHAAHATGPIHTYAWPRGAKQFLVLPDWEKEKVVFATPKRRPRKPEAVDGQDLIRRHKVAEKLGNQKVGAEKPIEGYRGVLSGNREHVGREWVLHYAWGTARLSCYLIVSITREGRAKWGDAIQSLLGSIEMTEPTEAE